MKIIYIDRRATPPKRVTSPTLGPPPASKQAPMQVGEVARLGGVTRLSI